MRRAHSYVTLPCDESAVRRVPKAPTDFASAMRYSPLGRDELLALTQEPWVAELHQALQELIDRDRSILSLASGQAEHELPFFLSGYDITASDLLSEPLDAARAAFPGLKTRVLDALALPLGEHYDDVIATGIDYALDDSQLNELLRGVHGMLAPGGRFIFVLRYHDNAVTKLIDLLLLPIFGSLQQLAHRLRRDGLQTIRREHGYRRTRSEIARHAHAAGYRVGRVRYACFALELRRLPIPDAVFRLAQRVDRRLHILNSATVFELLPVG